MDFETIKKLKDCCAREAALRVNVYPKWVAARKMTQEQYEEYLQLQKKNDQLEQEVFNKKLEFEGIDSELTKN